ncbi:sensor histidine kinase [Reinekea blandensis]|uniref:histidine kinase n=1 Tax=Reinekea blandensis MED297 TaxID=314283 RepID=A4B9Q0_9GAMM|nr:PAS domain-containing sensor histidine kinase [Reinekea blandensis]EAR11351.1 Multi-sensor Signal Transduction Histidine Kinase [Reinekea sp. MED297] [Reinekea blandensis MED297]
MKIQDLDVKDLIAAITGLHGITLQIHQEFKPIFVTEEYAHFYGYDSAQAFLDQGSIWAQIPDDVKDLARARYHQVIEQGYADPITVKTRRSDGEEVWLLVQDQRLRYLDGYCVMSVLVNIDDEVQLRERYEAAALEAERARNELEQLQTLMIEQEKQTAVQHLLRGVSHQINTPLGNIRTSASIIGTQVRELLGALQAGTLRQSQLADNLNTIQQAAVLSDRCVDQADRLIRNVKYMVADEDETDQSVSALARLLKDSVSLFLSDAEFDDVKLQVAIDEAVLTEANPNVWMQIMSVLTENALVHGFTEPDQTNRQIELRLTWEGDSAVLTFADNGVGIPTALRDRVFEPFTSSKIGRYSGVGLALVHSLVTRRLNGTIRVVDSPSAQGTALEMRLPFPVVRM